jgi:hypothetical protein
MHSDMGSYTEMELAERISELQRQILARREVVKGADAIKNALVLPFIRSLGYDVFDPFEIVSGYVNEGTRADYAFKDGDDIKMLMTLSTTPADLQSDRAQLLIDCMTKSGVRCAILTDGSVYRVHTDVDGSIDPEPLLVLDFGSSMPVDPSGLEHLTQDAFDIGALAAGAQDRRFRTAVLHAVGDELADPTEGFVELIKARLKASNVAERDDLQQILLGVTQSYGHATPSAGGEATSSPIVRPTDEAAMTADEELAFQIVRAMCARHVDAARIVARPAKSYVAVLLDDNNRRPVARIHFKALSTKYLGTFVGNDEARQSVAGANAIYAHEELIVARLRELDPETFASE